MVVISTSALDVQMCGSVWMSASQLLPPSEKGYIFVVNYPNQLVVNYHIQNILIGSAFKKKKKKNQINLVNTTMYHKYWHLVTESYPLLLQVNCLP